MRKATLDSRPSGPEGTLSKFTSDAKPDGTILEQTWLERGWYDNQVGISCIPPAPGAGSLTWLLKWQYSPDWKCNLYHFQNVPGRTVCMCHSGNVFQQVEGCAICGNGVAIFPAGFVYHTAPDGTQSKLLVPQLGITDSRNALAAFEGWYYNAETGQQEDIEIMIMREAA